MPKSSTSPVLDGTVAEGFEAVRDACWQNIEEGKERGCQVVCYHKGRCVLNISGGRSRGDRLKPETPVMVFSTGKVMESLVVAMLVDRGLLKYDGSLKALWPELKVSDKVTVGDLMKHQAGLLTNALSLETINDPDKLAEALAETIPVWDLYADGLTATKFDDRLLNDGFDKSAMSTDSRKRQAYHAVCRGWFASELCRRVDPKGRTLAQYFREEVVGIMSAKNPICADIFMGCSEEEEKRCGLAEAERGVPRKLAAHLVLPKQSVSMIYDKYSRLYSYEIRVLKNVVRKEKLTVKSLLAISGITFAAHKMANSKALRMANVPSATCCATAQALAAVTNELACVDTSESDLISKSGLNAALETSETLIDEVLCRPCTYTNCGFGQDRFDFVGLTGWYGWGGTGGSVLVFNRETQSTFCYVPSKMAKRLYKARGARILKAFVKCIKAMEATS